MQKGTTHETCSIVGLVAASVVASMLLGAATESIAGDQFNCVISGVGTFSSAQVWYLQCDGGTRTNYPCSPSSVPNQWAKPWSDANSKEMYALAMVLWMSGNPVRLNGTGGCSTEFTGREILNGLERNGM